MTLRPEHRALLKEALRLGVIDPAIVKLSGHHPRLVGEVGERRFSYPVGSSRPGDCRSFLNIRAGLRRKVRELAAAQA